MKHNNPESVIFQANIFLNVSDPFHDKIQVDNF